MATTMPEIEITGLDGECYICLRCEEFYIVGEDQSKEGIDNECILI